MNKSIKVGKGLLVCLIGLSSILPACSSKKSASGSYSNYLKGEMKPEASKPCFNGAYYRKVVSSNDHWLGITGTVVLPQMDLDPSRLNPRKPQQYLDNSSIYLGGNMEEQETDIGLIWEVIRDERGNVSAARKAFRPFLRRTSHDGGQESIYFNAPAESRYYWYPGEEVTMSVQIIADKKLKFIVEGAGKRYETDFECDGYKFNSKGEFKRVNAIDQVANEGKPVQPTKTRIYNAHWKETSLFRTVNGKVVTVPFNNLRYTDMRCPEPSKFKIEATEADLKKGAEIISISGAGF